MRRGPFGRKLRVRRSGGVVLDVIVGAAIVVVGAFALYALGLNFEEIARGAGRFFGI
jgi:hypothetical protein